MGFHAGRSSSPSGPNGAKVAVCGSYETSGASGAGLLDATEALSFPSLSPTGLADGFGAGRSPTDPRTRCGPIHPKWWFPGSLGTASRYRETAFGIRRRRTVPPLAAAVTTALRYRTLIEGHA
ncbi:hypothetical protein GCM10010405_49430 [Streptomyces macrosporus]|uniref:Uncharacterized protein n=1 Tax=Streptomyces macrosporus TaxID=44032 RepID=A0ABP5XSZ3_9ACTN